MADLSSYVAASMCAHVSKVAKSPFLDARSYQGVNDAFLQAYGVELPLNLVVEAVSILVGHGFVEKISDPYTADYIIIDETGNDNFFSDQYDVSTPFGKANKLGLDWTREAIANIARAAATDPYYEMASAAFEVPAADRIVTLTDNSEERDDVIEGISELVGKISATNDEDGRLVGSRERVVSELTAGQELLKSPTVRIRAVVTVLIAALGFIATEFAGGIIGDLAVKLLEQLRPILGI